MTTAAHVQAPAEPASRRPVPRLGITLIAAAAFLLELAVSGRYGYVRDELYVLSAGRHLAFGSRTGGLWISDDGGDRWVAIGARLPPILAVTYA